MLDYETLDAIADTYTPVLATLSIGYLLRSIIARNWRRLRLEGLFLFYGMAVAYGLMFLDNQFALWPIFGLDYSTHTAVALVLLVFLGLKLKSAWAFWLGSLISYALLMIYQNYHSLSDILTTALALCMLLLPAVLLFFRYSVISTNKTTLQPDEK